MRCARWATLCAAVAIALSLGGCGKDGTSPQRGASALALVSGNNQNAPAGTALPLPLAVKVTDTEGNAVAAYTVNWQVVSGGGSVSAPTSVTDGNGVASTQRTLGPGAGPQSAFATASRLSGSPVAFSHTAGPNGTISGVITVSNGFLASLSRKAAAADPPLSLSGSVKARAARSPLLLAAVTAAPRASGQPEFAPGELIVTFRSASLSAPPIGSRAMANAATARSVGNVIRSHFASLTVASGAEVVGVSPTILAARIRVADASQVAAVAAQLRADPAVGTVEGNAVVRLHDDGGAAPAAMRVAPTDPLYAWQAWDYGMIDLPRAWAITTGSAAVLVAVVDNGIRFEHPDISANLTADGYDFVSDVTVPVCAGGTTGNAGDGNGYDADPTIPADYNVDPNTGCLMDLKSAGAHGLHVAGTIGAAGDNGVGGTGVNWHVKIRPVRVLGINGSGTFYDVAQGLLYAAGLPADDGAGGTVQAATGARIINMSLGGPSGATDIENAVIAATNAGSLIIASAGNAGSVDPSYPAAYPEVLSVSAVGPDSVLASYSSFGSTVDLAAPGGDFADGDATFGITSTVWNFTNSTASYAAYAGTSMAAPHVSGVAALLLAQNPSLTAADLRTRLTTYAVDVGPVGPDDYYGAGIVNAQNGLTQSVGPPRSLYARLYDSATGAVVQSVAVPGGGAYAFSALADASYFVLAGQDESDDQQVGLPGRRWGAFGGSGRPSAVVVAGAGTYPATFAIGFPMEVEPNEARSIASVLVVGGYQQGVISVPISATQDLDGFRVVIPQAGTYTFETSGWTGACGFALEEDTVIGLYDGNGVLMTSHDDIDANRLNYCSRITASLSPGTYYVAVVGYFGLRYRIQARAGS